MKKHLLFILSFFIVVTCSSQIVMVGPMVQLNFEGKKVKPSFAVEASYWLLKDIPYGFDAALEFQKGKFRIYTEAQTGIGLAGISAGPFVEFSRKTPVKAGMQFTAWANYFIGADVRLRVYNGPEVFSVGIYGKLPAYVADDMDGDGDADTDWWDLFDD
jgi:hypothetical protein